MQSSAFSRSSPRRASASLRSTSSVASSSTRRTTFATWRSTRSATSSTRTSLPWPATAPPSWPASATPTPPSGAAPSTLCTLSRTAPTSSPWPARWSTTPSSPRRTSEPPSARAWPLPRAGSRPPCAGRQTPSSCSSRSGARLRGVTSCAASSTWSPLPPAMTRRHRSPTSARRCFPRTPRLPTARRPSCSSPRGASASSRPSSPPTRPRCPRAPPTRSSPSAHAEGPARPRSSSTSSGPS
mmetsp:Transcript_19282/g.73873  ORF Transcript_19282/g.73873 Transcript_19282/m.73873 type:complete len:241 (-) Transcript_19282:764-1486(-)